MDNPGDAVQKIKGAGHEAAQAMDRNDARVQRKINPRWACAFGRIGYITRGVIYIIIGVSIIIKGDCTYIYAVCRPWL